MSKTFNYDVFISHSSKDKPVVRELAERLKGDGLRVWFDERQIQPDDPTPSEINERLEQSRTLVLVMSVNAFASEWVTLERHTVMFRDPTNAQRRFIPLRLDDAEIVDTLRQFAYVDWRQKSKEQYKKLLAVCQKDKEIAAKPTGQELMILKGHNKVVGNVIVTPDGKNAVSVDKECLMKLWDLKSGDCIRTIKLPLKSSWGLGVTPDSKRAVCGLDNGTIEVWDMQTSQWLLTLKGHADQVPAIEITPDGKKVVSGSTDKTLKVWDLKSGRCLSTIDIGVFSYLTTELAITPDGKKVVVSKGSKEDTLGVWDIETGECLLTLEGHTSEVIGAVITPDGKRVVSSSDDKTLKVWDLKSGRCLATFEGHTSFVYGVTITPDGRRIVSSSSDKTLRVWDLESGQCLTTFKGHTKAVYGVAVTPDGRRAVSASEDHTLRVWELSEPDVVVEPSSSTQYTNAKVLLVGDSGVGKSGLAIRLTEDGFRPTISTDGAWATHMQLKHDAGADGIEREIWLWDFGGQADYRLIQQLFMDETALAVHVFDPQDDNPFEGLGQWDRDIQRASRRPFKKLLVAGRCDRGGMMVSKDRIEGFLRERDFSSFLETSARTGVGCSKLHQQIVENIRWEDIPWTATPRLFKLLKNAIIKLKDEGKVLLRMTELRQQLEMMSPEETFTLEELRAVVGLLVGPGAVWKLEFGDFVLLQPERISTYAAAVIRSVRAHTEEIGCIPEEKILDGKLDYQKIKRLPHDEEQIVLRAMHQTLVGHGICLRENTDKGTQLVFPSYFKRERPALEDYPAILVTYRFSGPLEEIYATLVVRLFHTTTFDMDTLWQYAADFKTPSGKRLGLKMTKKAEGSAEITIYFDPKIPDDTKVTFILYVHDHLKARASEMTMVRHYVCPHCQTPVESYKAVQNRRERGFEDIICANCEERVPLIDLIEQKFASDELKQRARKLEEESRISIDNESKELILMGDAYTIVGASGQIYRQYTNSDHGIDGEIEFKNNEGEASGKRVYLQLKHGDSYLYKRKRDGKEIFTIRKKRHAEHWQAHAYPVMLVIRTSDGQIRWMNVTDYLKRHKGKDTKQIVFDGEPFTALNVAKLRDKLIR
jgi:small GTP-binding protein